MAVVPRVLNNMNLFIDGIGYAGKASKVKLPKLSIKTEEFRGGGMDAPVEIDVGMEKITAEFTLKEFDENAIRSFGLGHLAPVKFAFKGAMEHGDGNVTPVEVKLSGMVKELDPDEWEGGKPVGKKFGVSASFYELSIGGVEMIYIDIPNMVRRIGGKDYMENVRSALGV